MLYISHIYLHDFINFNILNVDYLIDAYNDRVILRIFKFRCYGVKINSILNNTLNLGLGNINQ